MGILASSGAVRYRCRNTGKCCRSFRVGVDPRTRGAIEARAGALGGYRDRALFEPGEEGSFLNHAFLARRGDDCVFLRPDVLCDLHAEFGEEAKPLVCRQYPFEAVGTPRGTSVGLLYSCPSAVRTLREEDRFERLADPSGFQPPPVTKKVPADYPLLLAPGRPVSWEGFWRIEDWLRLRGPATSRAVKVVKAP